MVTTKKYIITCVVWDIMKNIGTCLQKKKLHKVGPKTLARCYLSSLTPSWVAYHASTHPPHMQDFMNLNDDVYCAPTYHVFSSCDDHEIIEEFNNEEVVEKDALDVCVT